MQKSLILALALAAAPVFAGEAPIVTVPAPAPAPAPACCPLSVEVAGVYGFAMGDIYDGIVSKDIDVYGADITFVYNLNENHSVNLRFGYTFGDECVQNGGTFDEGMSYYTRHEIDVHTFTLMPGYRYTHAIDEDWSVYAGANIGIANVSVKDAFSQTVSYVGEGSEGGKLNEHDSDWGFAWSVEIGASYKMSDNWYAFATYGLFGSTAEPELYDGIVPVDQQWYQGIRLGVGCEF